MMGRGDRYLVPAAYSRSELGLRFFLTNSLNGRALFLLTLISGRDRVNITSIIQPFSIFLFPVLFNLGYDLSLWKRTIGFGAGLISRE
jgi:hypothetical protein